MPAPVALPGPLSSVPPERPMNPYFKASERQKSTIA